MQADDVMVLEVDGEGKFGEHYLIGRLRQRSTPHPNGATLNFEYADNDQVRETAFKKARALAAGRDVFFTRRSQPGYLQDHYNTISCPKCGMYTRGVEVLALANGAQSVRCYACQHTIEMSIKEP